MTHFKGDLLYKMLLCCTSCQHVCVPGVSTVPQNLEKRLSTLLPSCSFSVCKSDFTLLKSRSDVFSWRPPSSPAHWQPPPAEQSLSPPIVAFFHCCFLANFGSSNKNMSNNWQAYHFQNLLWGAFNSWKCCSSCPGCKNVEIFVANNVSVVLEDWFCCHQVAKILLNASLSAKGCDNLLYFPCCTCSSYCT